MSFKRDDYPLFFFSRKCLGVNDLPWIIAKLKRLNDENRRIAVDMYEQIYLKHFNQKKYLTAREEANSWLVGFVSEFGITKREVEEIKSSESNKKRINEMIQKCKDAKPRASILGFDDSRKTKPL